MELAKIAEVTNDDSLSRVNERLRDGWVLLGVASGVDERGEPSIFYSLGRPEEVSNKD